MDVKELVNTGLFNLEVAQAGYGWLQDLHAMTVREVRVRIVSYMSEKELIGIICHLGEW